MKKFKYEVELAVEVEAWDEADAWEALQDVFSVGDQYGIKVVECEYREYTERAKRR